MRISPMSLVLWAVVWAFPVISDDVQTLWRQRAERLRADPSVVRFYSFQEGTGDIVGGGVAKADDKAGGDMLMVGYSPYGLYRGIPHWPSPAPAECPRWATGRWPWKSALACGETAQLVRSGFHSSSNGIFSVETWVRPHPLKEEEWVEGVLLSVGASYGPGWRLYAARPNWGPQGTARFTVGVPGQNCVSLSVAKVPFAFGSWHHIVAIWDGKEARLHIDGKHSATSDLKNANPTPPPYKFEPENNVGGLTVGGKLRFDIDEIVIYNRALSVEEVSDNYSKFKPQALVVPTPDKPDASTAFEFPIQSGGYFPVGKPIKMTVKVDVNTVAKCIVRPKGTGTPLFEREERPVSVSPVEIVFTPERCGLFDVELSLAGANGSVCKRVYPIGVTAIMPSSGDAGLGVRHEVSVQPWGKILGIGWGRVVVNWGQVEPMKELYDWVLADQMMETAAASGLKIVCCVTGWPNWLKLDASGGRRPVDLTRYKDFLRLLASRYPDTVEWEVWNSPFDMPPFTFREGKDDYVAVVAAAKEALRRQPVNQGGLRLERFGIRQPAGAMGVFDPSDFGAPCYAERLKEIDGVKSVGAWPWQLMSAKDSAVNHIWKVLELRAAGAGVVIMDCPPDEYYPAWNNSDGTPSLQGVAVAALASALSGAVEVKALSAPEGLRMFRIARQGTEPVTIIGAKSPASARVRIPPDLKALDWQGNASPLSDGAVNLDGSPIYISADIKPEQMEILK